MSLLTFLQAASETVANATAETIEQVMPKFLAFIGDLKLVAHNADFDVGFLKYIHKAANQEI